MKQKMTSKECFAHAARLAARAETWYDFDRWDMSMEERLQRTANDWAGAEVYLKLGRYYVDEERRVLVGDMTKGFGTVTGRTKMHGHSFEDVERTVRRDPGPKPHSLPKGAWADMTPEERRAYLNSNSPHITDVPPPSPALDELDSGQDALEGHPTEEG
jgi:hypothetical protein